MSLAPPDLLKRLRDLGHGGASTYRVVESYQRFHGLEPTGTVDPATAAHALRPRCALPDVLADAVALAKWDRATLAYWQAIALPWLDAATVAKCYRDAWDSWAAVCGLRIGAAADAATAQVVAVAGAIDGPGQVLAWSELPGPGILVCHQTFDVAEAPYLDTPEKLTGVIAHEIGHALGLSHSGPGQLMAPVFDPAITRPQAGDIAEVVARYGPAPAGPPAGPTDAKEPVFPGDGSVYYDCGRQLVAGKVFRARFVLTPE